MSRKLGEWGAYERFLYGIETAEQSRFALCVGLEVQKSLKQGVKCVGKVREMHYALSGSQFPLDQFGP